MKLKTVCGYSYTKIKNAYRHYGLFYTMKHIVKYGLRIISAMATVKSIQLYRKLDPKYFNFKGKRYAYLYELYNTTWRNERSVEVPIIYEIVKEFEGKDVLEVGNVLSHYFPVGHDILDKYEKSVGVINEDVVDFSPNKQYDLIVSISTLEHVGFDEVPKDYKKIFRAIVNLKNLLKPTGVAYITLPIKENPEVDDLIFSHKLNFNEEYYFKKDGHDWLETVEPPVSDSGLLIAMFKK